MKITGELLKSERIKKDLSIQDVAYALKLSVRIITAIESGDTDDLPAKTFVRGFVKSYADYLKIDSDAVLKQFQEEMGSTHPVPKTIATPASAIANAEATQAQTSSKVAFRQSVESINGSKMEGGLTRKNIIYFAIVTSLVIVIAIINKVANHYQNEIPQVTDASADGVPVNTEVAVASSPAVVATESVPNDIANALSTSSTITGGVEIASTSTASPAATVAAAKPAATASAAAATTAPVPAQNGPENTAAAEKSKGQAVEVLIEAKKDSYIDYAKGNTSDFKRLTLKANTYQILKSQAGLHLRAADGSAVSITVNGVSKGPMAPANKFVEMTF